MRPGPPSPPPRGGGARGARPPPMPFITRLINVEDMVRAPGTPWIIASGLADGERTDGHIYLVNARNRSVRALLPGHVDYRPDANAYPACPGKPDEAKFSAHGLSLRRGPQGGSIPFTWCITASGDPSRCSSWTRAARPRR